MKHLGKNIFLILLCFSLLSTSFVFATGFSDVKSTDWFNSFIESAVAKGIVAGYPDGTFRPQQQVTYAEFIVMAVQGEKSTDTHGIAHWGAPFYYTAIDKGIFTEQQIPVNLLGNSIPRKDMALIMSGVFANSGMNAQGNNAESVKFSDVANSDPYYPAIALCSQYGCLSGYPGKSEGDSPSFRPDNPLSRAESATAMVALRNVVDGVASDPPAQTPSEPPVETPAESDADLTKGKAWYSVDQNNRMYVMTDLTCDPAKGYSVFILWHCKDGSTFVDWQLGNSKEIRYTVSGPLSYGTDSDSIVKTDVIVFDSTSVAPEFMNAYQGPDSLETTIKAYSDHILAHAVLDNHIVGKELDEDFKLLSFEIKPAGSDQETYVATVSKPITARGDYGLFYDATGGRQNHGMTYIGKGDGILTFTREKNHFSIQSGDTGMFQVVYFEFAQDGNGQIICSYAYSNQLEYTFQ